MTEQELERIRSAYAARELAGSGPYRWDNPGYVVYMQALERAVLRAFRDADVPIAGARVLDVGCGTGYFLHRLREYGAGACHGIDLMEDRVATARQRYPGLEFNIGSATELPYAHGSFDLVTQFTCLSSVFDPGMRLAVAQEMRRVARGGWILSFDMRPRRVRRDKAATPTVGLGVEELERLLGEPRLLRLEGLDFELAQHAARHPLLGAMLGTTRFLRSHLLGVWQVSDPE